MTLPGKVIEAVPGMRALDCNQHLSVFTAAQFRMEGFRLAFRYVGRTRMNPQDLTTSEASGILGAGLGLNIVQHVHPGSETKEGWPPTGALGRQYGSFAAQASSDIGYKYGGSIWCDLEGVAPHTDHRDVIAFCNYWYDQVGTAGYTPGLYVGFNCGLNAEELHSRLKFEHYWGAFNLNSDEVPAVRGLQVKQGKEQTRHGITFDPDSIQRDLLGGLPLMHVDMEWTP